MAATESTVPFATLAATLTTMVAERLTPGAVAPAQVQTTGLVALQIAPALGVIEANVLPAASGRLKLTPCASLGPALLMVAT